MKIIYSILFFLLVNTGILSAHESKVDVVVAGGNSGGVGAALRASQDGLNVVLIEKEETLGKGFVSRDKQKLIFKDDERDRLYANVPQSAEDLQKLVAGIKNLKIMTGTLISSLRKRDEDWELVLADGTKIITKTIVDATKGGYVGYKIDPGFSKGIKMFNSDIYGNNLYRTSIGDFPIKYQFLGDSKTTFDTCEDSFMQGKITGVLVVNSLKSKSSDDYSIRSIQQEILKEKFYLIRFWDVLLADPHYEILQKIALTGIYKAQFYQPGGFLLFPDKPLRFDDTGTLSEYYLAAKFWSHELYNPNAIKLSDALSFIQLVNTKISSGFIKDVEQAWKKDFHLNSDFDLDKVISRREFAVLLDHYLKPFDVPVDIHGNLIR